MDYGYNGYGGGGGYDDGYGGYGGGGGGYEQSYGSYGGYGGGGGGYGGGGYGGESYGGGRGGNRGGGRGASRGARGGGGGGGGGGGRRGASDADYWKDPESEPFRKLFIGGLSYETTEEGLKEHFGKWGEVVDVVVMRDASTKRSRGFGFITYEKASSVEEAQINRPHKIDGREVESKRAMPRNADGQTESSVSTKKLFVGGIKDGDTEDDVKNLFNEVGVVEKVNMVSDKNTGKQKPFCFITFQDTDATDKCVLKHEFDINGHKVQVKKAEEKNQASGGGGGRGGGMGGGMGRGFGGGRGGFGGGYDQGFGQGYGRGGGGARW